MVIGHDNCINLQVRTYDTTAARYIFQTKKSRSNFNQKRKWYSSVQNDLVAHFVKVGYAFLDLLCIVCYFNAGTLHQVVPWSLSPPFAPFLQKTQKSWTRKLLLPLSLVVVGG